MNYIPINFNIAAHSDVINGVTKLSRGISHITKMTIEHIMSNKLLGVDFDPRDLYSDVLSSSEATITPPVLDIFCKYRTLLGIKRAMAHFARLGEIHEYVYQYTTANGPLNFDSDDGYHYIEFPGEFIDVSNESIRIASLEDFCGPLDFRPCSIKMLPGETIGVGNLEVYNSKVGPTASLLMYTDFCGLHHKRDGGLF